MFPKNLGNDYEVKVQEVESDIFQEVERTIRRSKVSFFRRSKIAIKFVNIFQKIKSFKSIIFEFDILKNFVSHKYDQEIKSLNNA